VTTPNAPTQTKRHRAEWLRKIPRHWGVVPLAWLARSAGGGTPSKEVSDYWNGAIPWVSPKDMKGESVDDTEDHLSDAGVAASAAFVVPPGNVLIVMRSGILKHTLPAAMNRVDCTLNQDMRALDVRPRMAPKYLLRFIQGLNGALLATLVKQGATVESIDSDLLRLVEVPVPPLHEQHAIAHFLDRETARIDALIEKKTCFIELLREKRQAAITQAVTKGIDQRAPTKPSGDEWLGAVPAHWKLVRFQRVVDVAEGQVDPELEPYRSMRLLAPNHVESGTGRITHTETAAEQGAESGKYLCARGDVVYSKIRPALRKACLAPERCLCSADMYPLRGKAGMGNQFLLWYLLSEHFSAFAVLEADRVAMPKINRESLAQLLMPLPSATEQEAICAYLTAVTSRLDSLLDRTEGSMALLKERRAALITAAVTGQIDVCEATSSVVEAA
jgi:type I restriction enzyme, S subunit